MCCREFLPDCNLPGWRQKKFSDPQNVTMLLNQITISLYEERHSNLLFLFTKNDPISNFSLKSFTRIFSRDSEYKAQSRQYCPSTTLKTLKQNKFWKNNILYYIISVQKLRFFHKWSILLIKKAKTEKITHDSSSKKLFGLIPIYGCFSTAR